ncbi:MAG: hypothetical protein Q9170_006529 [Blastenia crenularia]
MSWFWRGFQSAVFYYVSCAPCNELAYRRRRRKGAARSKVGNEMEEGLYPHPSPFSTNVYWREEMALGPGPPQKKKNRDRERQQRARGLAASQEGQRDLVTGSSADTGTSSADTVTGSSSLQGVTEFEQERRSGENWNRRRYQREDEFLWGVDNASEISDNYCTARNPAVNDLHPPVVSTQPTHRSETRWMLQPPPSAKVMSGKERANRSRSGSGGSNGSSKRGEVALGRQIGERMMEEKRRKERTTMTGSAVISRASSNETSSSLSMSIQGQRHDTDTLPPARIVPDSDLSPSKTSKPRSSIPRPITIPSDSPAPPQVSIPTYKNKTIPPHRPPLQTIISSTAISPVSKSPLPLSPFPQRPPLTQTPSASSLRVLQELISPSTALNARPMSVQHPPALPDPDEKEEGELEIPEVESFWPPPLGRGDGDGRRERWSMDV